MGKHLVERCGALFKTTKGTMIEDTKLPEIGQGEEVPQFLSDQHWFEISTEGLYLDFSEPYSPPRYTLSHGGVKFANLGDLHVITGKSGHGKTSFMSMLMAALLSGHYEGLYYERQEVAPAPKILYIDTEMGKDDTIAIKNRVCSMAGLDPTKPQERFLVARLRETEEAADRWRQVLKLIWEVRPTVVFLDGALDIVKDYNDQKECAPIVRQCMMVATHYDASVWCVLHENPTFEKMVGTLGSILQRKVTEVFAIRKTNQAKLPAKDVRPNRPKIYFTVDQLKARGKDVDMFDFEITSENGWGAVHELSNEPAKPAKVFKTNVKIEELRNWIVEGQNDIDWPASRFAVKKYILEKHDIEDEEEQKELIEMALNRQFFIMQEKSEMEQGQTHPKLKLNTNEIRPFGDEREDVF